jgi:DNA-binding transcriptional regulator PaaX
MSSTVFCLLVPIYLQNKGEAALIKALQELLAKHGLTPNSDAGALARVKAKLELSRDLEGIDMSNIISDEGGRPTRRAAAHVNFK